MGRAMTKMRSVKSPEERLMGYAASACSLSRLRLRKRRDGRSPGVAVGVPGVQPAVISFAREAAPFVSG